MLFLSARGVRPACQTYDVDVHSIRARQLALARSFQSSPSPLDVLASRMCEMDSPPRPKDANVAWLQMSARRYGPVATWQMAPAGAPLLFFHRGLGGLAGSRVLPQGQATAAKSKTRSGRRGRTAPKDVFC